MRLVQHSTPIVREAKLPPQLPIRIARKASDIHSVLNCGQSGGLTPLYQIGGPRWVQLVLKLQF